MNIQIRATSVLLLLAALTAATACGPKKDVIPKGNQPDKFLFDRGTSELKSKHWLTAREYFRRILDSYPQSALRPDSKLGLGDSYLGEDTTESLTLAINEYREFLTFYPTHERADYAQYKLGMTHYKQMRSSQRDQTETRAAAQEFEVFVERYPHSTLLPDAKAKLRESKDRLSLHEYEVGVFYFKQRWYPGAIDRLKGLLKTDPGFTPRDGAYYYLAESMLKLRLNAEALPYYEKLLAEFDQSEFLERAKQRVDELKTAGNTKPAATAAGKKTPQAAKASTAPGAPKPQ